MFKGIIEETGQIRRIDRLPDGGTMELLIPAIGESLRIGDSLAVNGCCLTVTRLQEENDARLASFDLLGETWEKTNFRYLTPGALVNLERPMKLDDRIDGHLVSGHIDGLGTVKQKKRRGRDWLFEIAPLSECLKYLVPKGSIALDGISLTVAETHPESFGVWIIPHTLKVTNLKDLAEGCRVNLEADLMAKYAERLLQERGPISPGTEKVGAVSRT